MLIKELLSVASSKFNKVMIFNYETDKAIHKGILETTEQTDKYNDLVIYKFETIGNDLLAIFTQEKYFTQFITKTQKKQNTEKH